MWRGGSRVAAMTVVLAVVLACARANDVQIVDIPVPAGWVSGQEWARAQMPMSSFSSPLLLTRSVLWVNGAKAAKHTPLPSNMVGYTCATVTSDDGVLRVSALLESDGRAFVLRAHWKHGAWVDDGRENLVTVGPLSGRECLARHVLTVGRWESEKVVLAGVDGAVIIFAQAQPSAYIESGPMSVSAWTDDTPSVIGMAPIVAPPAKWGHGVGVVCKGVEHGVAQLSVVSLVAPEPEPPIPAPYNVGLMPRLYMRVAPLAFHSSFVADSVGSTPPTYAAWWVSAGDGSGHAAVTASLVVNPANGPRPRDVLTQHTVQLALRTGEEMLPLATSAQLTSRVNLATFFSHMPHTTSTFRVHMVAYVGTTSATATCAVPLDPVDVKSSGVPSWVMPQDATHMLVGGGSGAAGAATPLFVHGVTLDADVSSLTCGDDGADESHALLQAAADTCESGCSCGQDGRPLCGVAQCCGMAGQTCWQDADQHLVCCALSPFPGAENIQTGCSQ